MKKRKKKNNKKVPLLLQMNNPCLKLIYKDEIRRLTSVNNFVELSRKACSTFSIQYGSFLMKYEDNEKDLCTITTEEEFQECKKLFRNKIMKIQIFLFNHKVKCSQCSRIVMGILNKCLDCNDYNLCNFCFEQKNDNKLNHQKDHRFWSLTSPFSTICTNTNNLQYFKEKYEDEKAHRKKFQFVGRELLSKKQEKKVPLFHKEISEQHKEIIGWGLCNYSFGKNSEKDCLEVLSMLGYNDVEKNINLIRRNKGDFKSAIYSLYK